MYSSYSTLQRKQLTKQVYTDTQSTYLLVYAPGRHQALEHALENQLHRKFRPGDGAGPRPDRLGGGRAADQRRSGVHLHRPDLFAAALRTGADFVVV